MMSWNRKLSGALATVLVTAGCMQSDVRHTWYLDPNGAVTWVVHEDNVRSDAQSPLDRRTEEQEYLLTAQQDRHAVFQGFRELQADRVRTAILRAEAPFTVATEARFGGLDALGQRLIGAMGATGTSLTTTRDGVFEWTLVVRDPTAFRGSFEPTAGVASLLDSLEHLNVVLSAGRFEEAIGFSLSADRRIATFSYAQDGVPSAEPTITLKLIWRTDWMTQAASSAMSVSLTDPARPLPDRAPPPRSPSLGRHCAEESPTRTPARKSTLLVSRTWVGLTPDAD